MRHENRPYYVGSLKAAELQGASHQAVMEFQVVTNRQMQAVKAGRSKIAFYFRKEMLADLFLEVVKHELGILVAPLPTNATLLDSFSCTNDNLAER